MNRTTDDRQQVITKAHLSFQLRSAKKHLKQVEWQGMIKNLNAIFFFGGKNHKFFLLHVIRICEHSQYAKVQYLNIFIKSTEWKENWQGFQSH